jgi:hypothetical protein
MEHFSSLVSATVAGAWRALRETYTPSTQAISSLATPPVNQNWRPRILGTIDSTPNRAGLMATQRVTTSPITRCGLSPPLGLIARVQAVRMRGNSLWERGQQPPRIADWQAAQQHCISDAVHRGVLANPDRQCQSGCAGKALVPAEHPHGEHRRLASGPSSSACISR